MPRIFPSVLPACATFALLTLAPPLPAQETASDTAAHPAAEEAADRPGMAEVEQAWARGDFVFVRDGLKALAEETGTPLAQYRYGRVLIEGRGGPRDIKAAVGWLEKAVAQNHADAATLLAQVLLAEGLDTVPRDPARAADLLGSAATRGDPNAQVMLARLLTAGDGVTPDPQAAFDWYLAAAEQGNVSAMHNLAVLYATEVDGSRDMAEAVRWFNEAADHGVTDSQVNLGILAARGEGVTQDLAESYKWLALAAKAGDKDAGAKRDEVAGFMRPDQLQTARDAVDLWKVKPVDAAANAIETPDAWKTGGEMTASASISGEDMKKAIRNIQAILNNNGYDAGTPDGIMGSRTRNAIIEFQKANGLLPSGEVDRALVDKLLEVNKQS